MGKSKRNYESEILDIIETEDWNKARQCNDNNLYQHIKYHRDTDKNCRIVWEHIKTETRDLKSEILEIVETKNWNRARWSNDGNLYNYIYCHRDTDKNCKIVWKHISSQQRDHESEIPEIIRTKDWDRAKRSNDINLYLYILRNKDANENCRIVWEHITIKRHCSYTIKDCLLDYFKHGKLENRSLRIRVAREIKKGDQSYIDIKNLIVAADTYKDPVALETLDLIKNHLEKEGT